MRAILTYHSLDESGSPISVSPRSFRAQIAWLATSRVRVLPLGDCVASAAVSPEEDAVAITFDDGCTNVASFAAPLLAAHGFPYTVFVVSGFVGRTNCWSGRSDPGIPELTLLSWNELGRLREAGAEIGAHTRTHSRLVRVGPEQVDDELSGSAREIAAELGVRPRSFAYPYGSYNAAVADRARALFDWSCTTALAVLRQTDDRALLPRLDMYYFREVGQLEAWGTPRFTRRLRARGYARRLRGLATRVGLS
jgi:peptidoglycan/xylan/chitin deacetylase (PgdA/CDA1 family)